MKEKIKFIIFTIGFVTFVCCIILAIIIPWFYGAMRIMLKITGVE